MLSSVDVPMECVFPLCKLVPLYYIGSTFLPALLSVSFADTDDTSIFHVNKDFYLFFGNHRGSVLHLWFHGHIYRFTVEYRDCDTATAVIFPRVTAPPGMHDTAFPHIPHFRRVVPTDNLIVQRMVAISHS